MPATPRCRMLRIHAFRGDRTVGYWSFVSRKIDDEANGTGPSPTATEILLYAGHAGISIDNDRTIIGFNPKKGRLAYKDLLNRLKGGEAFQGEVRDDTAVFQAARQHTNITVEHIEMLLPPARYGIIESELDSERKGSKYYYGFPNGDGDCNCATWIERVGVPLLTGQMSELLDVVSDSINVLGLQQRRFGKCV